MRGALNDKIQELAKAFLGREITVRELRLYPYFDYVMKNNQKLDPRLINQEEREIFAVLKKEKHLDGGMTGLRMTKEFYDYINQVLWYGYVVDAYTIEEEIREAVVLNSGGEDET